MVFTQDYCLNVSLFFPQSLLLFSLLLSPLKASKHDIILAPLFSHPFGEPVISQMPKEITIRIRTGRAVERLFREFSKYVSKYWLSHSFIAHDSYCKCRNLLSLFSVSLSLLAASEFRFLSLICNSLCMIITGLLCLAEDVSL